MPLKDKKAQLEYNKKWKRVNKEKVKTYQKNQITNKYFSLIQKIQHIGIKDKAKYLSDIHGRTREQIYKYFVIPFQDQIEKEIKKIKYYKNIKPKVKEANDKKWAFVKDWMTDRGCDCGEKDISKLSFHHLNPSKKTNTIRKMCGYSIKKIKEELKKGVVKCKNCHTIIHSGNSEEREEILINQYFNKKPNKRWKYKNKLAIWKFKKILSCIKCDINDPVILLFHHIDSNLKNGKISIIYEKSHNIINQEISKTVGLCHNCHEDFHYIYGQKNNNRDQLEQYIGKKVIPLKVDIKDYLPIMEQYSSQIYPPPPIS